MRTRAYSVLGSAALVIGAATLANGAAFGAQAGQTKTQTKTNENSRRLCRDLTPSGSHLTRRVCRTREEWDESRDRSQESMLQYQNTHTSTYEQMNQQVGAPR